MLSREAISVLVDLASRGLYDESILTSKWYAEYYNSLGLGQIEGKAHKGRNTNAKFRFNEEALALLIFGRECYEIGYDEGADSY